MRVLEVAISGEIVNDGKLPVGGAKLGFGPDDGPVGTGGVSVLP